MLRLLEVPYYPKSPLISKDLPQRSTYIHRRCAQAKVVLRTQHLIKSHSPALRLHLEQFTRSTASMISTSLDRKDAAPLRWTTLLSQGPVRCFQFQFQHSQAPSAVESLRRGRAKRMASFFSAAFRVHCDCVSGTSRISNFRLGSFLSFPFPFTCS